LIPFSLGNLIRRVDHFSLQLYSSRTSFICKCSDFSVIVIKANRIPVLHVRHTFLKYQFITKFPNASLNGVVAAVLFVVLTDVMLDANDKLPLCFHITKTCGKMEVKPHTFLTSALDGSEPHLHASFCFPSRKEFPVSTG
jgi:hypothetical protein